MVRVLSVAPYIFLPANTGGKKNIALFYKYFGQHVSLLAVTVKGNRNELAENYASIGLFSPSKWRYVNPFYFFTLKKLIQKHKATHILIEHPYMGWLAILLKKFTPARLIVHSHNIEGLRFKTLGKWWWKLLWYYERYVHRHADYNLFIQEADLDYAVRAFNLDRSRCMVLTYGIEIEGPPTQNQRSAAREAVQKEHAIAAHEKIILFVGVFNYKPNIDAFRVIKEELAPLLHQAEVNCKIMVCGPGLEAAVDKNIITTGFVEDISLYYQAADVFINPVLSGGGIKTKLVEALGWNTNAVSTQQGAIGINPAITNGKLLIVENHNWKAFANAIITAIRIQKDTPQEYYQHFYWGHSTRALAGFIA